MIKCFSPAPPAQKSLTNMWPACSHPCWALKSPVTAFRRQPPYSGMGIGKRLSVTAAHKLPCMTGPHPSQNKHTASTYFSVCLCSDAVHTAQAVKALLLPLDIVTGQTLMTGKTHSCTQWRNIENKSSIPWEFLFVFRAEDDQRLSMADQLKSKSTCVFLIYVCLTNAPQITLMVSRACHSFAC